MKNPALHRVRRQCRTGLVCLLGLILAPTTLASEQGVLGSWVLNNEATVEAQPEDARQGFSFGRVKPSVSIGGIPVPLPSDSEVPDTGRAQDPEVLRCAHLVIDADADEVTLSYDNEREARWRKGNYRGMTTRLGSRRLTSRYATLSRKVSKTFEIRSDGRLEVTVVINPKGAKKITYKRVFDRAPAAVPSSEADTVPFDESTTTG